MIFRGLPRLSLLGALFCGMGLVLPCRKSDASENRFRVLKMSTGGEINRADIWYVKPPPNPRAVLVLCPGCNGNGLPLIRQKPWLEFAARENLALAGIHFESPVELLSQCQGYYQVSKGSGDLLLEGVRKIYGKNLPILLFGFSGGAHFITRFIAWKPERVTGWAAGGAGVLEPPPLQESSPPGVMACGENDSRLGGALGFFKQGRAAGKPWLWVEMPKVGHSLTPEFEEFVRNYFSAVLQRRNNGGMWVDIDQMHELAPKEALAQPSLSGWIPDRSLLQAWRRCHASPTEILSKHP